VRERLANQSAVALARSQIIALDVGRIDLRTASVPGQDLGNRVGNAENDLAADFYYASTFTAFVDLAVTEARIDKAFGLFPWPAPTPLERWQLGCAVERGQSCEIGGQLITREQRGLPICAGLEMSQKRHGFGLAPLMTDMADDPQPARQRDGAPDPGVAEVGGIVGLQVLLLFLTNVQSSSTWAWVTRKLRIK